jgi:hypothetical protein
MIDGPRILQPDDVPFLCHWYQERGRELNAAVLPRTTYVMHDAAGPVAALALYMAQGAPVAFLDHAVTRPGLSYAEAAAAFDQLMAVCLAVAETMGCVAAQAHTTHTIAQHLHKRGWMEPVPLYATAVCFSQPPHP